MSGLRRLAEDDPRFAKFVTATRQVRPRPEALQGLLQKLPSPPKGDPPAPSRLRAWIVLAGAATFALAGVAAVETSRQSAPPAHFATTAQTGPPMPRETEAGSQDRSSREDAREGAKARDDAKRAVEAVTSIRVDDLPIAPSIQREAPAASSAQPKSLGREIELIATAREALTKGDPASSLTALRAHEREFPNGQFTLEARAMRVEATAARGDRKRARQLAREFLAHNPQSPYEARIRSLLASLETE